VPDLPPLERSHSERFLRATLDALEANIAVLDESGTIVAVNAAWDAFASANGLELPHNGVGSNYLEACDRASGPDTREADTAAAGIREVLASSQSRFTLHCPCHGPEEKRWFVMRVTRFGNAEPIRVVVAHENITERHRAELALRRSERLASIGTLAAGIAHEINNPLGALLLAARAAQKHLEDPERLRERLDLIVTCAQRCSGIVESLARCVRTGNNLAAPHDVNESLRGAAELLQPWVEQHRVDLRLELAETLPPILAAADDLRLAFFNLGVNAIQSCHEGGHVSFHTEDAHSRIWIAVQDDGRGMTEDEEAHAFDPFYSQRGNRVGSGLGLTLCHGIVTDHGGSIEVHSQPGAGTRVTIGLPVERERP